MPPHATLHPSIKLPRRAAHHTRQPRHPNLPRWHHGSVAVAALAVRGVWAVAIAARWAGRVRVVHRCLFASSAPLPHVCTGIDHRHNRLGIPRNGKHGLHTGP